MASYSNKAVEEKKAFGVLNVPSHSGLDTLTLSTFNKSKRQIAEELIKTFSAPHGPKPDAYSMKGLDLSGADLRGLDIRVLGEAAIRQINFKGADLTGQNFANMNLHGAMFDEAILTSTNFSYATLDNAHMNRALLGSATFYNVRAMGTQMNHIQAPMANWDGGFKGSSLSGDMSYGSFGEGTCFENASMRNVDLTGATSLGGDVNFRNADLTDAKISGDLPGADFEGATLTRVDMEGTRVDNAKMTGAQIQGLRASTVNMDKAQGHAFVGRNRYAALKAATPETCKPEAEMEAPRPRARAFRPTYATLGMAA